MSFTPRRVFIQCQDGESTITASQHKVEHIFSLMKVPVIPSVFDEIVRNAPTDLDLLFEKIVAGDEIFFDSRFKLKSGEDKPFIDTLFINTLMKRGAIHKTTGKSLYFLHPHGSVQWNGINMSLLRQLFTRRNKLFFVNSRTGVFERPNLQALLIYIQFKK